MSRKHTNNNHEGGGQFLRSRSISEPEINFDLNYDRFKTKHFPFEYIPVDDLHYYRRRKPCNCKKNLFTSTLNLCHNTFKSEPNLNGRTEYKKSYVEKANVGKLAPLKRPPYLKVDAYPFLTGLYKSDTSLNSYNTEYDTNFHSRPYSPRIGPLKRPPNIQLNPGVMDIRSEQKSKFLPYQSDIVSRARPPAIRRPNNLHLIGNIELFPEYKTKFIPYNFDEVNKINRVPCYHTKARSKKVHQPPPCEIVDMNRNYDIQEGEPRKLYRSNDYEATRYHENDGDNNNFLPEYRSQYNRPKIGERRAIIPQHSHFEKHEGGFNSSSEYNNRYKNFDQFTKSAPIKKEDNLYLKGHTQMQPEYKDRYKEIDYKTYIRQQPFKQQNNLYPDGKFPTQVPEYNEQYRGQNEGMPERAKAREDFLQLNGDMEYDTLHRNNYVEFPRQRPIIRKPSTHIQLSSSQPSPPREHRGKVDNLNLPITTVPYHEANAVKQNRGGGDDEDEVPLECTPEYRKAMRNYMLRERSPSRGSPEDQQQQQKKKVEANVKITLNNENDVQKILSENKVNLPPEKIFNDNNEIIVEPLKKPEGFKIPTRSPTSLNLGRGPTYPIEKEKFNEHASIIRKPRKHYDVSFEDEGKPKISSEDYVDDFDEENNNNNDVRHQQPQHVRYKENYDRPPPHPNSHQPVVAGKKKSPPIRYGRRATNPKEDYNIRKKTSVIEGNSTYTRDFCSNRHEQRGYPAHTKSHALPFAQPPSDPLANNYRPNYELDKQQSYREALGNKEPFVVLDRELQQKNKMRQSSWMKKQWYDTN